MELKLKTELNRQMIKESGVPIAEVYGHEQGHVEANRAWCEDARRILLKAEQELFDTGGACEEYGRMISDQVKASWKRERRAGADHLPPHPGKEELRPPIGGYMPSFSEQEIAEIDRRIKAESEALPYNGPRRTLSGDLAQ